MPSVTTNRSAKAHRLADALVDVVLSGRVTPADLRTLALTAASMTDAHWSHLGAITGWTRPASDGLPCASAATRRAVVRELHARADNAQLAAARPTLRRVGAELREAP